MAKKKSEELVWWLACDQGDLLTCPIKGIFLHRGTHAAAKQAGVGKTYPTVNAMYEEIDADEGMTASRRAKIFPRLNAEVTRILSEAPAAPHIDQTAMDPPPTREVTVQPPARTNPGGRSGLGRGLAAIAAASPGTDHGDQVSNLIGGDTPGQGEEPKPAEPVQDQGGLALNGTGEQPAVSAPVELVTSQHADPEPKPEPIEDPKPAEPVQDQGGLALNGTGEQPAVSAPVELVTSQHADPEPKPEPIEDPKPDEPVQDQGGRDNAVVRAIHTTGIDASGVAIGPNQHLWRLMVAQGWYGPNLVPKDHLVLIAPDQEAPKGYEPFFGTDQGIDLEMMFHSIRQMDKPWATDALKDALKERVQELAKAGRQETFPEVSPPRTQVVEVKKKPGPDQAAAGGIDATGGEGWQDAPVANDAVDEWVSRRSKWRWVRRLVAALLLVGAGTYAVWWGYTHPAQVRQLVPHRPAAPVAASAAPSELKRLQDNLHSLKSELQKSKQEAAANGRERDKARTRAAKLAAEVADAERRLKQATQERDASIRRGEDLAAQLARAKEEISLAQRATPAPADPPTAPAPLAPPAPLASQPQAALFVPPPVGSIEWLQAQETLRLMQQQRNGY